MKISHTAKALFWGQHVPFDRSETFLGRRPGSSAAEFVRGIGYRKRSIMQIHAGASGWSGAWRGNALRLTKARKVIASVLQNQRSTQLTGCCEAAVTIKI